MKVFQLQSKSQLLAGSDLKIYDDEVNDEDIL